MLPRKWTPMRELTALHRDLDEMLDRFVGRHRRGWPWVGEWEGLPAIDLAHTKDAFVVRVELPGIEPKDVEISLSGRTLSIKGERKEEKEKTEDHYYMREIGYGSFERSLTLPEGADTEKITASFKNGILEISMPAEAVEESRKIEVVAEEEPKKRKAA